MRLLHTYGVQRLTVYFPSTSRPLQDGDIVNVDITVYKDGFHGDTSRTFLVGDVVRLRRPLLSPEPTKP